MNLANYDLIPNEIQNQTYINYKYKVIHTTEVPYKKYHAFLRKYNSVNRCYDYFVIMSDYNIPNTKNYITRCKADIIKLDIFYIFDELIKSLHITNGQIRLIKDVEDDEYIVYKICNI